MKPTVFIGSTSEREDYAKAIASALSPIAEPRPWYQGVFQISESQQTAMLHSLRECDYVVIVLTGDDLTSSRGKDYFSPRDNLVFEAGISFGLLHPTRTFIVPEKVSDLKIPSDLNGFTLTAGIDIATSASPKDAVAKAVSQIAERIEKEGKKSSLQLHGDKLALASMGNALIESAEHHVIMFGGDLSWSDQYADALFDRIRDGVSVEVFGDGAKKEKAAKGAKALTSLGASVYFCDQNPGIKLTLIDHESEATSRFMISRKDKRLAIGAKRPASNNDISYQFHVEDARTSPVIWISLVSLYKSLRTSAKQYDPRKYRRLLAKKNSSKSR